MDVKISRNYSVYQNAVNSGRHTEKSISSPPSAGGRTRGDAVCISSDAVRRSEAASFASALERSMEEGASAEKLAVVRQQVQAGTCHVPAEIIAGRLMGGI